MTIIIAEAGVNHNGDIEIAKRLVDAAKESGADIVKFQKFESLELATSKADKAKYQKVTTGKKENQLTMLKKLEMNIECHEILKEYCEKIDIEFLSTPFDIKSVDELRRLNLRRWKIPSGEITNLPYLRHIGACKMPIVLSTGMANLSEIELALETIEQAGTERNKITLLHCTTEYPAPFNEINLNAMRTMESTFKVRVGYSDHSRGITIPIAAVALGASIIEKHITLDRNMEGPDHKASIEPNEFSSMVRSIREIEVALGDGIKRPTPREKENMKVVRKSIVAAKPIKKGEEFDEENLTTKRPAIGISPIHYDAFVGKRSNEDYEINQLIKWQ